MKLQWRFALFLILLIPSARGWTIEAGVILQENETTIFIQQDIEVPSDAYYDGNMFFIAPFGFQFDSDDGSAWEWDLVLWQAPINVTFHGTPLVNGTVFFDGFTGTYQVTGLLSAPTPFLVSGPSFSLDIVPGEQTFSITLTSLHLTLSSRFNPAQDTIASAATLLNVDRMPVTNASILHTVLRPDGSTHSVVFMNATSIPGVYVANVSVGENEPAGAWTVAVEYGGTVASETIIRTSGVLSGVLETALDSWIPLLIWGGLMIIMLWAEAWAPAAGCLMNLAAVLPTTPIYGRAASIMIFCVLLFVHVGYKIIQFRGWFRRENQ